MQKNLLGSKVWDFVTFWAAWWNSWKEYKAKVRNTKHLIEGLEQDLAKEALSKAKKLERKQSETKKKSSRFEEEEEEEEEEGEEEEEEEEVEVEPRKMEKKKSSKKRRKSVASSESEWSG